MSSLYLTRNGQQLACYAPGDGALSFSWMMDKKIEKYRMGLLNGRRRRVYYTEDTGDKVCSGRKVTVSHVRAFLKHKSGARLARDGWRLYSINAELRLVGPVKRIDDHTLNCGEYGNINYTLDQTYIHDDGKIGFHAIKATFNHKDLGVIDVKNHSMIYRIMFFLNHEKELSELTPLL